MKYENFQNVINEVSISEIFQTYQKNEEAKNLSSNKILDDFRIPNEEVGHTTKWEWLHKLKNRMPHQFFFR